MKGQQECYKFPRYDLKGKVAVVTGSGQGLGKWMALGLAEAGADILVADLVAMNAKQTSEEIKEIGRKATFIEMDVGDIDAVYKMMDMAQIELGGLDILVNNAGVNVHKKALDITPEDFDWVINVNSKGTYFCCQAAAQLMIPRRKGKIINIASAAAFLVRAGIPTTLATIMVTFYSEIAYPLVTAFYWAKHNPKGIFESTLDLCTL